MRYVRVANRTRGAELGARIGLADRWWLRLRGLLARPPLLAGEGLLLLRCRAVHTFGMRFPLDVAILDRDGRVVATYPALPPGRRTRFHRAGAHVLELPAGTLERTRTRERDRLVWSASAAPPADPADPDRPGAEA